MSVIISIKDKVVKDIVRESQRMVTPFGKKYYYFNGKGWMLEEMYELYVHEYLHCVYGFKNRHIRLIYINEAIGKIRTELGDG